jgi:hypothetical protein
MILTGVVGKLNWRTGAPSCAGSVSMRDTALIATARFRLAFVFASVSFQNCFVSKSLCLEIVNPPP